MDMRHLRAFLAVAEELHFTRAAKRLHVAQPAVSTAIRQLEEELGLRLFDRSRRRVSLTPAGERFRDEATQALARLDRAVQSAQLAAAGHLGEVSLQFTTLCGLSPLPQAVQRFRRSHPRVQLHMAQRGTAQSLRALESGDCDLAVSVFPGPIGALRSAPLCQGHLLAVLPEAHPLAADPTVPREAFTAQPMLILPKASEPAMHAAYASLCAEAGRSPQVALELDQIDAVLAFVAAGLGVSLAPSILRRLQMPGVVYRPITPAIRSGVSVIWNPERLSPAAQALLNELRAAPPTG